MADWQTLDVVDDWAPRIASMERLGASVEELAKETIESIMGFKGKGGHKPPRADIQKMKDAYDLQSKAQVANSPYENTPENAEAREPAQKEWYEKYGLTLREQKVVELYQHCLDSGVTVSDPQRAFAATVAALASGMGFTGHEDDAKRFVGSTLKKYEQQHWPMLYKVIENVLDDAYRRGPLESYKLWPRMVSWIKDEYQEWLSRNRSFNRPATAWQPAPGWALHILDITLEGGKILDQLRRENKLPQGFDVNRVPFKEFEEWLMQWKRENLGSEHAGQVVYKFHDDWTIQKLLTPDQLQFEGDEMGHCVGGYAHSVESGETIIYSLRDPKGQPHVTMEVEAQSGAKMFEDAGKYMSDNIHPDLHEPGQHRQYKENRQSDNPDDDFSKSSGDNPFEIVQIQGNSNMTPKPEYQRKIKEFLDALRAKGWKFVRSDSWYGNYDADEGEEYETPIKDASSLDDWYNDEYKGRYERYQKGTEDAYGMMSGRKQHSIADWKTLLIECCASLVDDYDRDRWKTNQWEPLAQAVWHAWWADTYEDQRSPETLKKEGANLTQVIEKVEEEVSEWVWGRRDYAINDQYREMIVEKFEELAKASGLWDQIYAKVEDEERRVETDDIDEWYRVAEGEYPDLFEQARDAVEDEETDAYAGNAFHFLGYLYNLIHHQGGVGPADLPNPNDRHGGLPSYEDLIEKNKAGIEQQQLEAQPEIEKGIPGALSSWNRLAGLNGELPAGMQIGEIMPGQFIAYFDAGPGKSIMTNWIGRLLIDGEKQIHVSVMPEYQRMGVATALLQHMQQTYPELVPSHSQLITDEGLQWAQQQEGLRWPSTQTVLPLSPEKEPYEHIPGALSKVAAVPLNQVIYIAEGAMERAGQTGGVVTTQAGHPWHPKPEGIAESERVSALATEIVGSPVVVHISNWIDGGDLSYGSYDALNNIIAIRPGATLLTLLHECAHALNPGQGHDAAFCKTARDLYAKHISPEAAEIFWNLVNFTLNRTAANAIRIHPIDQEHNVWFDEDGNERQRYRPSWAKDESDKMRQTGELEDSFLDKQGRQGEGWVAYHGDRPIGSLTYVDTPVSNMIGTAYVHPDYREQGIFNRLADPLRTNGKPTDAYVWNNPWLKNKVRDWGR